MTPYVIFNRAGAIEQSGTMLEDMLQLQGDPENGRFVMAGVGTPDTHWVSDGEIADRPRMPMRVSRSAVQADGTEEAVISGVPAGATIEISGPATMAGLADGADITLTFALAGSYEITARLFPFTEAKAVVNAF